MARTFLEFAETIEDQAGALYVARVAGARRDDGRWIGWIEFLPVADGPIVVTGRETTQPDRADLAHWATGLTRRYMEGALHRAKRRGHDAARAIAAARRPVLPASAGAPRLEVESADPLLPDRVLEMTAPLPGTVRQVPGAGMIVYEGVLDGGVPTHFFVAQYGSRTAGATLANWLWSRLHPLGVVVKVEGEPVELTNDGIRRAMMGA